MSASRGLLIIVLLAVSSVIMATEPDDTNRFIAYSGVENGDHSLYVYDSIAETHTHIHNDVNSYEISAKGEIVFSSNDAFYLFDSHNPNQPAVNLTQQTDLIPGFPLAWSLDGELLALSSLPSLPSNATLSEFATARKEIYLWDGKTAIDVTPQNLPAVPTGYVVEWNAYGQFAVTIYFKDYEYEPEIYLWTDRQMLNLSQNLRFRDYDPTWNVNGELAFWSERSQGKGFYIWDGISFADNRPNAEKFQFVPQNLRPYPKPIISDSEDTALFAMMPQGGQQAHIFTVVNDAMHNLVLQPNQRVWNNEPWIFVAPRQQVWLQNPQNGITLPAREPYPVWNSAGHILYCYPSPATQLILWDGEKRTIITENSSIKAQWQGGKAIKCPIG